MAPRSAKTKKTADVKVAENEVPKKGRGKGKIIEDSEALDVAEPEINEKVAPASEKKAKRGKKAPANDTNGQDENGAADDVVPPAKKGRKKNNEDAVDEKSDDIPSLEDGEQNGVHTESDAPQSSGKGRKKQAKAQDKSKESGKTKKNAKPGKDTEVIEKEETSDEKPKSVVKGRGRKAQTKNDKEIELEDTEEIEEEVKQEPPATKGRKKGAKSLKENDNDQIEDLEERDVEEVKKNETKGKKNQGKKVAAKDEAENAEGKDDIQNMSKRKPTKKGKGKGDSKEEEVIDESMDYKPSKGKRGQKKAVETNETEDDPLETEEPASKRRRKPAEEKDTTDTKKKAPPKNKALTDYESIDFTNHSKNSKGQDWNFKISSWNVDGIRAWLGKGGLDFIKYEKPDILCLQEIKCSQEKLPEEITNLPGYHAYWLSGDIDGYSGVGIYTTKLAMNVQYGLQKKELDSEGRIITAEYEQFYLICTYVPNAGRKLVTLPKRLQWNEEFRKYVKELDKKKPVIICGDMNVAHNEIDLANPKANRKNAGFTEEERAGMTDLLGDGFVDSYRHLYPDTLASYTFWTYMMNSRAKNVGWRLDYFIVSERLLPSLCDKVIRDKVYGSDHCPITLFLHLTSAVKPKE